MAQIEKSVVPQSRTERLVELEYQLKIFEAGIKSEFWQTLAKLWKPLVDSATGAALQGNAPDRSFLAGKANGLHNFLTYPEKHVKRLQAEIKVTKDGLEKAKT